MTARRPVATPHFSCALPAKSGRGATAGCDVLAFGPHPDDVELVIGGTMAACAKAGLRVVAVEMTRGESGTRGDAVTREREACRAAKILGLAARENLGLPDAHLEFTLEYRHAVADAIRRHRPDIVLAPWYEDAHPDHAIAGRLVQAAFFEARLKKLAGPEGPWFARLLYYYPCRNYRHPDLVVDVTDVWPLKKKAMYAHRSQVGSRSVRAAGSSDVFANVEFRDRHFGALIGRPFGEGLVASAPLPVTDPRQLLFGERT